MSTRSDELILHFERLLDAPRSLVFRMYSEPSQLKRWWGPKGFTAPKVDVDLRVGGRYRIEMQPPAGNAFVLSGEFIEVDAPARLSYTFQWEDPDPDDRNTIVSISLRDLGNATQLIVEHGPFATEARRALHDQGWTETLDRLQELFT